MSIFRGSGIDDLGDFYYKESNRGFRLLSHELEYHDFRVSMKLFKKVREVNGPESLPRILEHLVENFTRWDTKFFEFIIKQLTIEQLRKIIPRLKSKGFEDHVQLLLDKCLKLWDDEDFLLLIQMAIDGEIRDMDSLAEATRRREKMERLTGLHVFFFRDAQTIKHLFATMPPTEEFYLSRKNPKAVEGYKKILGLRYPASVIEEKYNLFVLYEKDPLLMIAQCKSELEMSPPSYERCEPPPPYEM